MATESKIENQATGEAPAPAPAPAAAPVSAEPVAQSADTTEAAAAGAAAANETPVTEVTAPAATPAPAPALETPVAKEEIKEEPKEEQQEAPKEPAKEAPKETPLTKLASRLDAIKEKAGHAEMWGVNLADLTHIPTQVILQKFLRANDGNVDLAEKQLTSALEWRKKNNPGALLDDKTYDRSRFGDLGFVTVHQGSDGKELVVTWNVYGSVKNNKKTFGNVQEFIEWRAALMELGVRKLKLNEVTEPIPEGGQDPYQMIQVHDYMSVSFLRMDPHVKAASRETINTFSMAYPELLSHKFFVNVPAIMGWVFGAMKLFLSPATIRKFHPLTSGSSLAGELKQVASSLPKEYGGVGPSVKDGLTVKLADPSSSDGETPKAAAEPEVAAAKSDAEAPSAGEPVKADDAAKEVQKDDASAVPEKEVPTEPQKDDAPPAAKEEPAQGSAEAKPQEAAAAEDAPKESVESDLKEAKSEPEPKVQ